MCGRTIGLPNGKRYAEAHHIKPLGQPHCGPDILENIVCVCPNHHAELDYGVVKLNLSALRKADGHTIDPEFITYHNRVVFAA
jgi:predicted restriction endonuclease